MHFVLQVLKGIFIGAGAILPGVSSGVLCVAFGIYEKLLCSITGFFSNVKENFKFLFPIALGTAIGVIVFGNLLKFLFANFEVPAYFCFAGLILGSIPGILREAYVRQGYSLPTEGMSPVGLRATHTSKRCSSVLSRFRICPHHVLSLLLTLSFSIYLVALEHFHSFSLAASTSFSSFLLAGFAMSAGVVIPGVSSTIILMLLGKYEYYLSAISSLDLSILFPMGIGLVIGSLILLFVIKFLLKYFKRTTYFAIIGFVLGSIPVLIPPINNLSSLFTGIIFCVIGIICGIKLSAVH